MDISLCSKCGFPLDKTKILDQLFQEKYILECGICGSRSILENHIVGHKYREFLNMSFS